MKNCAFLTLDERGDFVIDDEHAIAPMAAIGWEVSTVSWRQTRVPWDRFDAVVIRSTWDYWNDVPAFLEVLARIDGQSRLANPLELVHWNLAKTYLRELESGGVRIVPTMWPGAVEPGSFAGFCERFGTSEVVIKPVVGANGDDTYRILAAEKPERLARICRCFRGREAMVQPFMPCILGEGEYSLFYFNGEFSHAIRKVPAQGEFRSQEERGAEILSVKPDEKLLFRGQAAMTALAVPPLYARVDLVRDGGVDFAVMELELIEPSLYLRTDPDAPARFARAIDRWFR